MAKQHHYKTLITWTGNRGEGTSGYRNYDRAHIIQVENKEIIRASSDPAFLGDPSAHNPEDLLLASLSSCHMLWYLHLCADNGVVVLSYSDNAAGIMEENPNGGKFIEVTLHPVVKVAHPSIIGIATALHAQAHKKCFIANSCNFPVKHEVNILV
ncbi:MAG: OsmC family protein [Rhizobacter sp.]|nr:OsmC family protein [Ferruginibacter sp.]